MKQETKGNGQKHKGDGNTTKKLNLKKKNKKQREAATDIKSKWVASIFHFFYRMLASNSIYPCSLVIHIVFFIM